MQSLTLVFAGLAGLLHILFFVLESLLFMREKVYRRFGARNHEEAEILRTFAVNQGAYNLLLAAGMLVAVGMTATGMPGGTLLLAYCGLFMVGAALTLAITVPGKKAAVLIQGGPPAIALVLMLLA